MTIEEEMEYIAQQNNPYTATGGGLRYLCNLRNVEYSDDEPDNLIRDRLLVKIQNEPEQDCKECENETMLKYSSLYCDYEDLQERLSITSELLNATAKMADYLTNKCDELANKVKLYKEKCEREE